MPNADASIRVDTRIDGSGINKGVKDIDASLSKVTSSLGKFGGALGSIVGVIVSAGGKLWNLASEVATAGDEIEKTSQKVGLSYKAYQKWDYAMKICGTEMSSCAVGLKTLTNTFDDAISGSSSATEKFERLGLSIDDLRGLSREDLFATVVTALQNVEGETEKAALANDLFGRSGQDLAPLLNLTADELGELMDEAEAYGIVMSDDAVKASAAFEDSLTKLEKTLDGLKAAVVGPSLPAITRLMDSASGAAAALTQYVKDCKDAFEKWLSKLNLEPMRKSVSKLKEAFTEWLSSAKRGAQQLAEKLEPFFRWMIEKAIPGLISALSFLAKAVGPVVTFVVKCISTVIDAITWVVDKIKDAINWIFTLFGLDPPFSKDNNAFDDLSASADGYSNSLDGIADSYSDIEDAAEDAEDAIEGAKDAADAGGSSGGSGGSEKGQDVLGFDAITKLSDQSGGSGGKGGGSGAGDIADAAEAAAAANKTAAAAQEALNDALDKGSQKAEQYKTDIGTASHALGDLSVAINNFLDSLFKDRSADLTLNLKKGKDFDSLKKEWDELEDREITGTLKLENFDAPKLEDQDVTTTLNLKKGKDFDRFKQEWGSLVDEQVLKELETKLEVAVKTDIEVAIQVEATQQIESQTTGEKIPGWQNQGGKIPGYEYRGSGSGFSHSSGSFASQSDMRKDMWNNLPAAYLKLFSGGYKDSDKNWLKDLFGAGAVPTAYRALRGDYWTASSGSVNRVKDKTLKTIDKWWNSLKKGSATKTLDLKGASSSGSFGKAVKEWEDIEDESVTKTLDGKPTASLLSALKDWVQAKTETVKKTVDGSKTSGYTSILTNWSGWKNQTVVKTTKAEYGKNYQARLKEWVDIKDKNVEANLAINPTVSNMKSFLNSNIIEKLNSVFKKSLPDIRIPKLATGTIVNRATFAMIGENGPEAVMPLKNHTEWIDMLADRIAGRVGGSRQPMIVQVLMPDGRVLGETVVNYATSEAMRTGQLPWAAYE